MRIDPALVWRWIARRPVSSQRRDRPGVSTLVRTVGNPGEAIKVMFLLNGLPE